jgi:hypothetical protein
MHSLLDVIKGFCCIKDCEDNSPLATIDPRNELTIFEKLKFRSRFAIGEFLRLNFPKNILHMKILISQVIQCISFFLIIVKYSTIYAQQPSTYFSTILDLSEINVLVPTS